MPRFSQAAVGKTSVAFKRRSVGYRVENLVLNEFSLLKSVELE